MRFTYRCGCPKHQNRDNGVKITMPSSTPEGNRDGWFMDR
jgi:hypothetical protein